MSSQVQSLVSRLGRLAPIFQAKPEQISFLSSPSKYYEFMQSSIKASQRRVSLASLYFGTEDLEQSLVKTLREKLATSINFKAHVHMDYLRGTRGFPGESSATLLRPLLKDYNSSLRVTMYMTPLLHGKNWRSLLVPPRWNEIFGLSHFKVCIFDDTVVISGANFSKSYFTDREDRYVCIKNHPLLAEYFTGMLEAVSKFSYTLLPESETNKGLEFIGPEEDISKGQEIMEHFLSKQASLNQKDSNSESPSVFIIPSLQIAPHGIRQDEEVLEELLHWTNSNTPRSEIALATGYFNLSPLAQHIFTQAKGITTPWRILTSSPEANGFFESKGMSGYIPDAYRSIEYEFLCNPQRRPKLILNETGAESIYEYSKPGWTFHAKGLWIDSTEEDMVATVIGSSNFGHRSFDRDMEAQLTIISTDLDFNRIIRQDRDCLFHYGKLVSADDIIKDGLPHHSLRTATSIIKSFL